MLLNRFRALRCVKKMDYLQLQVRNKQCLQRRGRSVSSSHDNRALPCQWPFWLVDFRAPERPVIIEKMSLYFRKHSCSVFFNLNPVWEFYWLLVFVNFITLITLKWSDQFITSRQLFLAIKLIVFLYISNSKYTRAQLWNSQTGSS